MKAIRRVSIVCLASFAVGVVGWAAFAVTPGSASAESLAGSPLVVDGLDVLVAGELSSAQRNLELSTPEAQELRVASQSAYEGLSASEAEGVTNGAFASVVDEPDGGVPALSKGARVTGFPSDYAASLLLAEGQHAVLESSALVAGEGADGSRVPLNLRPEAVGGAFEAAKPLAGVGVRAGAHLSEGASLSSLGVSLTPVTGTGVPLEASGVVDGASVFYGDSEDQQAGIADLDSLVKFDAHGFREDSVLRSERAPSTLYFKVGLPQGATLTQNSPTSVLIVDAGNPIASIGTSAQDANGTSVPVSVNVSGNVLALGVEHSTGQYRMPIEVDPTVSEGEEMGRYGMGENWEFATNSPKEIFTNYQSYTGGLGMEDHDPFGGEYSSGEYGLFGYETGGESRIYEFVSRSYNKNPSVIGSTVYIAGKGGVEGAAQTAGESNTVCVAGGCTASMGSENNWENGAFYKQTALAKESSSFEDLLEEATEYVIQEKGPVVSTLGTCGSTWTKTTSCGIEMVVTDPGLGVSEVAISSPSAVGWGETRKTCLKIQCDSSYKVWDQSLTGLPEGEDTVKGWGKDPVDLTASSERVVKIDNLSPHNIALSGLGPGGQIGAGEYELKAEATDGSGSTPSSGVSSISVWIDGREVGSPSGSCSPGPCTAHSGTWQIFGRNYAAGRHTVSVVATDNAGNTATEKFTMIVRPAAPIAFGPGAVNSGTGEMSLTATDVSMPGGLTVARSYGSEHLTAGANGPLGPEWAITLGGEASLIKQSDGSMVLTEASGAQTIFTTNGTGGYVSPGGDANLTLSDTPCEAGQTEFMLRNASANTTTCFKVPSGGSGEVWEPSITKGTAATDTVTYAFQTVEVPSGSKNLVTRPTEALAAVPAGVSCSPELKNGCRALTFSYATATTAKGEALSEWGEYEGDLSTVYYTAMEPATKEMKKVEVARYEYDKKDRLRAEWDPRLSEPLKTYYGYDGEEHLTALTPPGQETWGIVYGAAAAGGSPGSTLKVMRAPASAAVWSGEAVANTGVPVVTGAHKIGVRMAVSEGKWSGSPLIYGYQWEDCNSTGGECAPIVGATNANYKPVTADEGHKLAVVVTATNGSGSVSVTAYEPGSKEGEGEVRPVQPGSTVEYGVPVSGSSAPYAMGAKEVEEGWAQKDLPAEATAVFPPDEPQGWPASSYKRATIYYRDSLQRTVNVAIPGGGISTSEYNEANDVTRSLSADDRALALKEAHPAEVAKLLDTQSEYNTEGSQLLATLGPRHTVKLPSGKEVLARNHTVYEYDKEAPSGGGPYNLVTKTTEGAKTETEGEQDIRTTVTSYGGQEGLGWKLRKPTSITTSPAGLKLTRSTIYNENTGSVIETRPPATKGGSTYTHYQSSWGTSGPAPLNKPEGIALDSEGHIWVADTENNRVVELSSTGTQIRTCGSFGVGNGEFNKPGGIAVSSTGYVWIADTANNRIQELSSTCTFVRAVGSLGTGNLKFKEPHGLAVDSAGHVWVADTGNNRIQEVSAEGAYMTQYGTIGTGHGQFKAPDGVAIDKTGDVWVADTGNGRVQELTSEGAYVREFGKEGIAEPCKEEKKEIVCTSGWATGIAFVKELEAIAVSSPNMYEDFKLNGEKILHYGTLGNGEAQFESPKGLAPGAEGSIWVADQGNSRIQHLSLFGQFLSQYPSSSTPTMLNDPQSMFRDSTGNFWIADTKNHRIQEVSASGSFIRQSFWNAKQPEGIALDSEGNAWFTDSIAEGLVVKESSAMDQILSSRGWGSSDFNEPVGIALSGETLYVVNRGSNTVEEFEKYTKYVRKFGTTGPGNGQFSKPQGIAIDSKGDVWIADTGNNRIEEFNGEGTYLTQYGTLGTGAGQFSKPEGIAIDPEGDVWVADTGNNRVQELSSTGIYIQQFGGVGSGEGNMKEPASIAIDSSHHMYVLDSGNGRIETWQYENGKGDPHATQTIYYSAGANASYPGCGEHPEWATLTCQVQPAEQPNTSGLPNLPVTTYAYNMYAEPTKTVSTVGTETRTTTIVDDAAGRPESSETTSTTGTALPKVSYKYSKTMGMLVEQSTSSESLKREYNTLEQLVSYTDAAGNVSSYEYEKEKDYRLKKLNDGKGTQTYEYDQTTGVVKELIDSAAGKFTATYDVEENLTSETYPNAMTVDYTRNVAGQVTSVTYVKTAHCAKTCPETWYTDTVVPSIHGQWNSQQSELEGKQTIQGYTDDEAGRLTQVTDNLGGKDCITRIYGYDEETNRVSLTTRAPGSGGACATEGGEVQTHTYDSANRLTDAGTKYEAFGNTTELSASDAGGGVLTSTYYQDNQLATQTQGSQTISYQLDPADRVGEIVSTGKIVAAETQHYTSPESTTPAWTGELSGNYTREITGIGGTLVATQHNGETPVLQLSNLHGDIIATAKDAETTTTLASTIAEASEYGVPATETPPKYSWLGAHELPTALPSGVMTMGVRSYVPQLGRFLQTDPIRGGSVNAYAYVFGNPVNTDDLTGERAGKGLSSWALNDASELASQEIAAYETALREEAERKAQEAEEAARAFAAMMGASPQGEYSGEEGPEEEEMEEGEGGEEDAAFGSVSNSKGSARDRQPTQSAEGGVFFQSLASEEDENSKGRMISRSMIHLCERDLGRKACASYVGFFGWLKKEVKSKWHSLETAAKSTWNAIKASVIHTFHTLGYGDLVCYKTGCMAVAATIYDGYKCLEEQDCEAFSQDLSENL